MMISLQRLKRMLGIIIYIMMISPSLVQAIDLNDTVQPPLSDTALPDLFSGTMNFQIPIEVPPGINGLQPALTLFYRSSNGNGWLGQGWEMEAGALERSTKTGAADYTADNYLFRNTGTTSELVPIGNGEFRRKVESDFLRFETSYCIYDICNPGDPSYLQFKATNKLGIKYYFGATGTPLYGDSGARITGAPGTFRWALGRVQDTSGNVMTYIYQVDNGQIYLSQINYNGNQIIFSLEDRTDVLTSTLPGFTVTTGKRLKQIDVRSKDGNLMNRYVLNYDTNPRSMLRSVQKVGRDEVTVDLSQTFAFVYTYYNSIGDVLTFIQNGYGATANISYIQPSSASYVGTPPNPIPLAVNNVRIDDDNLGSSNTAYSFSGGYYYSSEKDFRGFNHATVTGPIWANSQKITETWFHQGNDLAVDANTPAVATGYMKGKPYRVRVSDASGFVYSEIETLYAADKDNAAPWFNPASQTDTYVCDGKVPGVCKDSSYARHFKTQYIHDSEYPSIAEYGNLSLELRNGDVDDPNDDFTTYRSYLPNALTYIVGLPSSQMIVHNGNLVDFTNFYYDGVADCNSLSQNQTPDKGKLTRIVRMLRYGNNPDGSVEERMAYDSYGNLICRRDANGNTTNIGYDPSNTFPVLITNPLGQQTFTQYYGVDNVPADYGLYGQVKSVTDTNGATTFLEYDLLGRKAKETLPDNTSTQWIYNNVIRAVAAINSTGPWNINYFDGLNRVYKIESRGPDSKIITTDTRYDTRGNVSQITLPYFADTETPRFKLFTYDAIGRLTESDTPISGAIYATVLSCHDRGVTVIIDPNKHRRREVRDAYGRLTQVQEYIGTYSSCTTEEGSPYATTTYEYDILGNLTLVTDAKGNRTEIKYDSLGRKRYMSDPDMGVWTYNYYNNGNLETQKDANGKTITFLYDALNRLTTKHYPLGQDVVMSYDEARPTYFNKGRLKAPVKTGKV